jgi:hypothetical protein
MSACVFTCSWNFSTSAAAGRLLFSSAAVLALATLGAWRIIGCIHMSSIMKRSTSMACSKRKQQPAAEQQPTAVMSILVWGVIVADITS